MILGSVINVFDYMTAAQIADVRARTKTLDVTAAINAAIADTAGQNSAVFLPAGTYKTTAPIYLIDGVQFIGEGYWSEPDTMTTIHAVHTGACILGLKGVVGCTVSHISLETDTTTYPKTGLMLGRTTVILQSAFHTIEQVRVYGYFSQAAIYSIAAEINSWKDIYCWLLGGAAKYCFYTSEADDLTVDSLFASTNLQNTFTNFAFFNGSSDSAAACIYLNAGSSSGNWTFMGGYLTPLKGSYIHINVTQAAPLNTIGPFTFVGVSGEILTGGDPEYGVLLTATTTGVLVGLTVLSTRFDFVAGPGHYPLYQPSVVALYYPNIVMQAPVAFPYAVFIVDRTLVNAGVLCLGRAAEWTAPTLSAGWSNTYGSPFAPAGYMVDGFGFVHLRGTVTGGSGAIFTLPYDLVPTKTQYFIVYATTGVGRVSVAAVTGVVSLVSGTATEVDLSSINFKIN